LGVSPTGTVFASTSTGGLWTITVTDILTEISGTDNVAGLTWTVCDYYAGATGTTAMSNGASVGVDINGIPYVVDASGAIWMGDSAGN